MFLLLQIVEHGVPDGFTVIRVCVFEGLKNQKN